jgi:hypothetical protein
MPVLTAANVERVSDSDDADDDEDSLCESNSSSYIG